MEKEQIELLKKIDMKLGALIALQMIDDKPEKAREKIKLLSDLGFSYTEIASILNVPAGYVSKERSLIKKKSNGEEKQDGQNTI